VKHSAQKIYSSHYFDDRIRSRCSPSIDLSIVQRPRSAANEENGIAHLWALERVAHPMRCSPNFSLRAQRLKPSLRTVIVNRMGRARYPRCARDPNNHIAHHPSEIKRRSRDVPHIFYMLQNLIANIARTSQKLRATEHFVQGSLTFKFCFAFLL
jgi:hypothetical protein